MTKNKKQRLLKKYQNLFNLNEWNITLNPCHNCEVFGEAEYLYFSKVANIFIKEDLTDEEYEHTMIHEFLHLCLAPIEDYTLDKNKKDTDLIKQIVEHIAIKLEKAWVNK